MSRQGHGEPNPTWIPAGNEVTRRLADRIDGVAGGSVGELGNIPMTAHIIGGAPIGLTADDGVVDPWQRLHGYDGLHVTDGAAVTANLGVNPSLTITAQAERAMAFWPNKGEADPRPALGHGVRRAAAGGAAASGRAGDRARRAPAPARRDLSRDGIVRRAVVRPAAGRARSSTGGYRRFTGSPADRSLREWFAAAAAGRGLAVEVDRAGNQWAWWGDPTAADAVVVGSHLDSVPDGGAYDGPLGVVSGLAAVEALRSNGFSPTRPLAVVNMAEEEGATFGLACLGSRLLTGVVDPQRALALRGPDGATLGEAMQRAGRDPGRLAAEPDRVARIGAFVELHVEQGLVPVDVEGGTVRGLAGLGRAVGVASEIWPHGRWRIDLTGRADHAGTTALADRDDPMLALAELVLAARDGAADRDALATVGKVAVRPNAVNAIPSSVTAWLDVRGADESRVRETVAAAAAAVGAEPALESWTARTGFDGPLSRAGGGDPRRRPAAADRRGSRRRRAGGCRGARRPCCSSATRPASPTLPTSTPRPTDCRAGVAALTAVLRDLAGDAR